MVFGSTVFFLKWDGIGLVVMDGRFDGGYGWQV